ncbi:MAG: hypothetical protein GY928_21605 [Colwellia sp.]|nr:hypothetical protein [Colwellia sp.]
MKQTAFEKACDNADKSAFIYRQAQRLNAVKPFQVVTKQYILLATYKVMK